MTISASEEGIEAALSSALNNAEGPGRPARSEADRADVDRQTRSRLLRARLHDSIGKVTLAMMQTPRYRHLPLGDLQAILVEPMLRDRVAIAAPRGKDGAPETDSLAGVAIWASVDERADERIRAQIRNGVFPVRLAPDEWRSGKINWLLDVIASSREMATSVIGSFRQALGEGELRLHPVISQNLDPDALRSMGAMELTPQSAAAADAT